MSASLEQLHHLLEVAQRLSVLGIDAALTNQERASSLLGLAGDPINLNDSEVSRVAAEIADSLSAWSPAVLALLKVSSHIGSQDIPSDGILEALLQAKAAAAVVEAVLRLLPSEPTAQLGSSGSKAAFQLLSRDADVAVYHLCRLSLQLLGEGRRVTPVPPLQRQLAGAAELLLADRPVLEILLPMLALVNGRKIQAVVLLRPLGCSVREPDLQAWRATSHLLRQPKLVKALAGSTSTLKNATAAVMVVPSLRRSYLSDHRPTAVDLADADAAASAFEALARLWGRLWQRPDQLQAVVGLDPSSLLTSLAWEKSKCVGGGAGSSGLVPLAAEALQAVVVASWTEDAAWKWLEETVSDLSASICCRPPAIWVAESGVLVHLLAWAAVTAGTRSVRPGMKVFQLQRQILKLAVMVALELLAECTKQSAPQPFTLSIANKAWDAAELETAQDEGQQRLQEAKVLAQRPCANPLCSNVSGCSEARLRGRRCSGCRAVRYCSRECQAADFARHSRSVSGCQPEDL
ncbi:hypothetical protein N2152v2_010253 [Parachlorella kessleri]